MSDTGIDSKDPSNCLYMEANPGDGGTHNAAGVWWLSPDVVMTGPDPSKANPSPTLNTTNVTVHWKDCNPFGSVPDDLKIVVFDLYIGDPTLTMIPGWPTAGCNLKSLAVAATVTGIAQAGPPVKTAVNWTASATSGDPDFINGIQHKCMVARCYPFGATPDPGAVKGYPAVDAHYAQRNLVVVGVGSKHEGGKRFPIKIGNAGQHAELVRLRAFTDFKPTRQVLDAILPSLKATPGFKQIAPVPLHKISFDLSNLGGAKKGIGDIFREVGREVAEIADKVEDGIEKAVTGKDEGPEPQKIEAHVSLAPKVVSTFDFIVDPTGATPGNAHIYHLTQENSKGQPEGGLTVIFVIL